ncbi:MAG: hypothetical protein Q8S16_06195, partial [Polaromonas sp.]|nr:hypothetical protein [Polaromonas sp.]
FIRYEGGLADGQLWPHRPLGYLEAGVALLSEGSNARATLDVDGHCTVKANWVTHQGCPIKSFASK